MISLAVEQFESNSILEDPLSKRNGISAVQAE